MALYKWQTIASANNVKTTFVASYYCMRYFLLSLLITGSLTAFTQFRVNVQWSQYVPAANSDTIYYNGNQKLSWPDFKAMPVNAFGAVALTSSGFGYTADIQYENGRTDIVIEVYCYFSKQNSWVIPGLESDYALNHEQRHFDITYIAANLFIKKLNAAKFTEANYTTLLDDIYKESRSDFAKLQNDYDSETRNGQLKNIQEEWDNRIVRQLLSFKQ